MFAEGDTPSQIRFLENTKDNAARDALALRLAEEKVEGLEDSLIKLIKRPELANNRGTLVHALSYYDCSKHLNLLVELIITGNWEVAHQALQALETVNAVDGEDVERAFVSMNRARLVGGQEDWRQALLDDLDEMFV